MISIIIVTKDRPEDLELTLSILNDQYQSLLVPTFEVIIVDNNSDCKLDNICNKYEWAFLLKLNSNKAMAATNDALRYCKYDHVMVLDDDATPDIDCLSNAVSLLKEYDAIECEIEEEGGKVNKAKNGLSVNFIGCGAFFKKETLIAVGGYSEKNNWSGNEKDLVYRLVLNGIFIHHSRDCVVKHRKSIVNRSWLNAVKSNASSAVIKAYKYHPLYLLPLYLSVSFFYNIRRSLDEGGLKIKTFLNIFTGTLDGFIYLINNPKRTVIPVEHSVKAHDIWIKKYNLSLFLKYILPKRFWY